MSVLDVLEKADLGGGCISPKGDSGRTPASPSDMCFISSPPQPSVAGCKEQKSMDPSRPIDHPIRAEYFRRLFASLKAIKLLTQGSPEHIKLRQTFFNFSWKKQKRIQLKY